MEPSLFVLDTSAIMVVLEDEPETSTMLEILGQAAEGQATLLLPFLALMEVEYILLRRVQPERVAAALSMLENWPATIVESNAAWRRQAAVVKASGGLSLADAWIAALATLSNAQLVHKDPEFDNIAGLRSAKL